MLQRERYAAHAELKYANKDTEVGELSGYAWVFGAADHHGDVIEPNAFDKTLANHKSKGTMPRMYAEHSVYTAGGDPLPVGQWTSMDVDEKGLRVSGHLIALDDPHVKRVHSLMLAGEMTGISIAFAANPDTIKWGTKSDEPRRRIGELELFSVDPVCDPANHMARIDSIKSANQAAVIELRNAWSVLIDLDDSEEHEELRRHVEHSYKQITGEELRTRTKPDTIRKLEDWMKESAKRDGFKFSNSEVRAITEGRAFKKTTTADPREEEAKSRLRLLGDIGKSLSGFSLPK
jgi:HK97 family phage prohead protease